MILSCFLSPYKKWLKKVITNSLKLLSLVESAPIEWITSGSRQIWISHGSSACKKEIYTFNFPRRPYPRAKSWRKNFPETVPRVNQLLNFSEFFRTYTLHRLDIHFSFFFLGASGISSRISFYWIYRSSRATPSVFLHIFEMPWIFFLKYDSDPFFHSNCEFKILFDDGFLLLCRW